jgi:hypothetical protein
MVAEKWNLEKYGIIGRTIVVPKHSVFFKVKRPYIYVRVI